MGRRPPLEAWHEYQCRECGTLINVLNPIKKKRRPARRKQTKRRKKSALPPDADGKGDAT